MNDPKSVQEINLAIARSLGVDTSNLRGLRLTLEPKYEPGQPDRHLAQGAG